MEGRISPPTQSETNSCPECGAEFEAAESLRDHFFDEHLVTQPEDAGAAEPAPPEEPRETGQPVQPAQPAQPAQPVQPEGGSAVGWSLHREGTDATGWSALLERTRDTSLSPRPERVADVLVALLALILAGTVGSVLLVVVLEVAL